MDILTCTNHTSIPSWLPPRKGDFDLHQPHIHPILASAAKGYDTKEAASNYVEVLGFDAVTRTASRRLWQPSSPASAAIFQPPPSPKKSKMLLIFYD
uniref:AP2/ERF domain-containing protein n=1 Tax=Panagrellus redivivus TaxID=6233 RepID=A0A7E4V832_PANRE